MSGHRLDSHLVAAGLARSRGQAKDLIGAGAVSVDGRIATRPSTPVADGADVRVDATDTGRWVGRAALKLVAAMEVFPEFARTVEGARCLDVGASTGGFTQVLLEHGARQVVALDVGHGQLAESVRTDPRVEDRSGTNIRGVTPADLEPVDVLVGDLSFISLTLVAEPIRALLREDGQAVLLVKPQFEVGRSALGNSGVVRSAAARRGAVITVTERLREAGLPPSGLAPSPTPGSTGNLEYLLWMGGPVALTPDEVRDRVHEMTSQEHG